MSDIELILKKLSSVKFTFETEARFLSGSIDILECNIDNNIINTIFKDIKHLRSTLDDIVQILDEIKKEETKWATLN